MNMHQGCFGAHESKYQWTGHNGCYSLSICTFWPAHRSTSTRLNCGECAHASVQVHMFKCICLHPQNVSACVRAHTVCCVSVLAFFFFLYSCSRSGLHLLARTRPRAPECAETAARAIDKCNGMTVLSQQFAETACLSAWLDGCCTWETVALHHGCRLEEGALALLWWAGETLLWHTVCVWSELRLGQQRTKKEKQC